MTDAKKPRLVWVAPGDRGGGVIWVSDSCCRQAAADGYEVKLLTLEPLSEPTMKNIAYPIESMDVVPPYTDTPERFLRWVEANQPDFVFLNNVDTMDCCIPYMSPEVRCIYVVHDTMSFYWKAAVRHEASLDAIVAVSAETGRRFRHKLARPEKLHVIQNGTLFPPLSEGVEPRRRNDIVFLGGDSPDKGAYDLFKLWPRLVKTDWTGELHWYGRLTDEFKARIHGLEGASRVIVHGHVPRTEVFERLERSAALLMLSRAEAFGLALVEGMAMGCVPVAWDIEGTGTKEIVKGGYRFLAPLADFADLTRRLLSAIESRDRLAPGLTTIARTEFAETRMWQQYRQLIEAVRNQPLAARPLVGPAPPVYRPPVRASHLVPKGLWKHVRPQIAKSAKLYYFLRHRM